MAKVIKLILTNERRGLGTQDDPVRLCPQLFTLSGKLIAEHDPMPRGNIANSISNFYPANLYHVDDA
jgi:hypothetical protein